MGQQIDNQRLGRSMPPGTIKFILPEGRSPIFDEFVQKYMGFHTMFPGSFGMEPTDQSQGQHEYPLDYKDGDVVCIGRPGKSSLNYQVPKGKKATKIKYSYEIELEDLPKCEQCHGSGQITLFTTIETCGGCNGSGYKQS